MRLTNITLENFRNYQKISIDTDADLILILGENASGKTNFLESIYFLSRLKSFRVSDDLLVKYQQDHFALQGLFGERQFEAIVQTLPVFKRLFKIDGQKTARSFWQSFTTVLFVPNDLNIFTDGPSARRKFLDEILSQKNKEYALALISLNHVLKQKSALLESLKQGIGSLDQLDFWNDQLADAAAVIAKHRLALIDFLSSKFDAINENLTGLGSKFIIQFKNQGTTKQEFQEKLAQHRQAEIASGMNLVGPHRDDFTLEKNGLLNIYNSSRGELRAQVLTLKLLQAEYLSDEKQKPIILLDDVFSELDETRRTKLIETLSGHQIFITSTEEHHLPKLAPDALILTVGNNEIK